MDINYLLALQNLRDATGGVLNGFMEFITKLGETSIVVFFIGLVYWGVNKKHGIFLMFSLYTNRIINGFIKITACVYRPWIRDARITPVPEAQADATGYSFPSGHTANATSVWGGLAIKRKNGIQIPKWFAVVMIVLVLLIAFSRNYLGVHTPQDVVVALVIGAAVLFLMSKLMPIIDERPNLDIWVMLGGVALCALLILYAAVKSYPTDYAADGSVIVEGSKMAVDSFKNAGMGIGFFIGWFIERRFIKFSTDNNTENIIRLIFGVLTYTALDHFAGVGANALIAAGWNSGITKALAEFVRVFYFVAGVPAIIKPFSRFFVKKNN